MGMHHAAFALIVLKTLLPLCQCYRRIGDLHEVSTNVKMPTNSSARPHLKAVDKVRFLRQRSARVRLAGQTQAEDGILVLTSERLVSFVGSNIPACDPVGRDGVWKWKAGSRHRAVTRHGNLTLSYIEIVTPAYIELHTEFGPEYNMLVRVFDEEDAYEEMDPDDGLFYELPTAANTYPEFDDSRCSYPKENASFDISTIEFIDSDTQDATHRTCLALSGCRTAQCKDGRQSWHACFHVSHIRDSWAKSVEDAYLRRNNLRERPAPAIRKALTHLKGGIFDLTSGLGGHQQHPSFEAIANAFAREILPYVPGSNSRSGASFFYSGGQQYIAKRVRSLEFDALQDLVADGKYRSLINNGSTLNTIYCGFESKGDDWIIMKAERLPNEVARIFPKDDESVVHFFMDVKPAPMTSDLSQILKLVLSEQLLRGVRLADFEQWGRVLQLVSTDISFLQEHDLIDYSFFMHGAFIDIPSGQQTLWLENVQAAIRAELNPGCAFGCRPGNATQKMLVDVTSLVGAQNKISMNGTTYKCCCKELDVFASASELSPCVLVNTNAKPLSIFGRRDGCANLVGKRWHSYWRDSSPGRCLVGLGMQAAQNGASTFEQDKFLLPETLGITAPPATSVTRCGIFCVSIADYLLPYNAWNRFESAALAVYYGAKKWGQYASKMEELLGCLGAGFLSRSDEQLKAGSQCMGGLMSLVSSNDLVVEVLRRRVATTLK
eukprot:TRINITY_DN14554_c0_g1_i1.p1 TRINITY_DN14554_c0_g1~~TRINITY_DN14554_c0_g1_i1.p1  ORF type:complete len:720 (-),score=75.70 TRINITY_DN14554_c0_g1_i1:77-2236(-)